MTTYKSIKYNISGADLTGLTAGQIPNLDASKITSGSLADARIPNLATSKITSGTFADARISQSSVVAHSPQTDLQPVKSDISALALREATNESSAAFNLPNQFIDTFTDDTNLGTQTTVDRNSGYIWSTSLGYNGSEVTLVDGSGYTAAQVDTSNSFGTNLVSAESWAMIDDASHTNYTGHYNTSGSRSATVLWGILSSGSGLQSNATPYTFYGQYTATSSADVTYAWDTGTTRPDFYVTKYEYHRIWTQGTPSLRLQGSNDITGAWTAIHNDAMDTSAAQNSGTFSNTTNYRYYRLQLHNISATTDVGVRSLKLSGQYKTSTVNATGTLIQSANTVGSAKTKVGGTMLYKDNAGTATIGTDLKIYFTCNGGTNWTEASSYSAITPVYSTGIKQVRLGETTCTSGTDVRYKAVWANQAASSKETQLHGIGVNY